VAVDRDQETGTGSEPTPTGINLAVGVLLVVGSALLAAAVFPASDRPGRVLLMAVTVGAYAAAVADLRAVTAVTVLATATFVGFLVHQFGQLTGGGWSYSVLIGFAAVLGAAYRRLRSIGLSGPDHDGPTSVIRQRIPGVASAVAPPEDAGRGPRAT
jgi:hypothetical protein